MYFKNMTVEYFGILIYFLCSVFLALFLCMLYGYFAGWLTIDTYNKKKYNINKNKSSVYECGFEPLNDSRGAFEVHFYIIALMFLLFDVELAFLMPWVVNFQNLCFLELFYGFFFLLLIFFGFMYEYKRGMLRWDIYAKMKKN